MQLTRESDYAIRCVQYVSSKSDNPAAVGDISEAQDIPRAFTAKILQKLVKANIVKSIRGVKGGFILARELTDISLFDVIEAIQGPFSINICVIDNEACDRSSNCAIHPVWVEIQKELKQKLKSYSFDKFVQSTIKQQNDNHNKEFI